MQIEPTTDSQIPSSYFLNLVRCTNNTETISVGLIYADERKELR